MTQYETKKEEQSRVTKVEHIIDEQLTDINSQLDDAQKETSTIEQQYGENTRVNTFEVDDKMETNAAVQQQKQMVGAAFENERVLNYQKKQLNRLHGSPYFGRIDITEDGQNKTFYIGTATLMDDAGKFLVYDWRAPISSIYYNGTLGDVTLHLPDDSDKIVSLDRKRQYQIQNGKIKNMFDTNHTVGDQILQNVLNENSSEYLKNIVATIQQEQNTIIRDTSADVLLVQGVAGSGKTSTVMQRIAYLLYHSRTNLDSDNMILFSPNKLFSNYISQVLPDLGEKNMRQVTLSDFLSKRLNGLKIETITERYEKDQQNFPEDSQKIRQFKESSQLLDFIDEQFKANENFDLEFEDILFNGEIFFSKEAITNIYNRQNENLPLNEKFLNTKNRLIKILKQRIKTDVHDDWVEYEIENLSSKDYENLLKEQPDDNDMEPSDYVAHHIVKESYRSIYNAIYNNMFWNPFKEYTKLLSNYHPDFVSQATWNEMIEGITDRLEYHKLNLSDAIPVLYLRDLITGSGKNYHIQHIFIDEIQDYSIAALSYITKTFVNSKLTLIGDINQNVFANANINGDSLKNIQDIFEDKKVKTFDLKQSYRSSAPITNFSKALLKNGEEIKTFSRDGNTPEVIDFENYGDYLIYLNENINNKQKDQETSAIITKTQKRAHELYRELDKNERLQLITSDNYKLKSDFIIIPISLAKGLEFDNVIVDDVSANNFTDRDTNILYTICTRAMHRLSITFMKQPAQILEKIDRNLYTKKA